MKTVLMPRERQNTVRMRSEIIRDRVTVFQTVSVIDQRGKMVFSMIAEPYTFRMFFAGAGSPESFFWDCANPARNVTALTGI
jgi:hypothetical protein